MKKTFSRTYFDNILHSVQTSTRKLNNLNGALILHKHQKGEELGQVQSRRGRLLTYHPIDPSTGLENNPTKTIEVVHIGGSAVLDYQRGKEKKRYESQIVYSNNPKLITAYHLAPEFSIVPQDKNLDELVQFLGLDKIKIKDKKDLEKLIKILAQIPRTNKILKSYDEQATPIGDVFAYHKPSCRHISGLAQATLLKSNIPSILMGTNKQEALSLRESHSFLKSKLNDEDLLVDPVNGWIFNFENAIESIKQLDKPTKYHDKAEPLDIRLNFK